MIPVRLKMRNFMCYRDDVPALEFNGIHLACLSGDNGNGKSALIDAMTWALWGRARTRSGDDLINSTQNEMEVEFDFTAGGQLYKIVRKRARPKKRTGAGQSSLEFQISSGNGFRPITGNTMDLTQQKIIEVLHMDYDTFVNSAYLRQGHADEFTRQDPAKRKEVLGNILGLEVYDELEERAKEMVKRHEADTLQLENTIRSLGEEIAEKPQYEEKLAEAQESLTRLESVTKEKEAARNELRKQKESLENKQAQLAELEKRLGNSARDQQRWQEQVEKLHARISEYEKLISQKDEIDAGYGDFKKARESNEKLEQAFRKLAGLEKQKSQLEARIQEASHGLTTQHTVIQKDISDIEEKLQKLPTLRNRLNETRDRIKSQAEQETELQQKEQAGNELTTRVNYLEAEKSQLEGQIGELGEKLDLITSHMESHEEAKCPLCETELTREGLELIRGKYTTEKQDKSDMLTATSDELENARTELKAIQQEKAGLEEQVRSEKTELQSKASVVSKEIADIEEEGKKTADLKAERENIEQRLATRAFAQAEQATLASIETELAKLEYDAAKHEEVRQQLAETEAFDNKKRKLDEAAGSIEQEKESAARAEEAVEGLQVSLKEDSEKKEAMSAELEQLPEILAEADKAEAEFQEVNRQLSQAQQEIGSIRSEIRRREELEVTKKEKEARLNEAAKETNIYRELAKAFGKTGIQALLIETAIPEIENEANQLLGRMTDNRMHVKFETQQETKSGTIRETLAINIADELGTRNYEMFSGGEAFRINFAIRIALSRLLAKRAGAPLPTLIIDEGFGTQDSTGMEKLKEVINSIQEDFEKVLVITHMDDLKDAFQTRIDVIKGAGGSTISVN